ncbi:uncharacterized protein MYCFIDRAFT_209994 [Pseudocercospora fijiensis CIRAD86]|uniref:Hydrophobin n=1 Tax=Pseudocercospora fijiensis (strain CIRAD86) TaxID=383855 RepID=N1Q8D3_PSEFD|nr:uncharacterized protein MYCFIDRAFT_209994 [Pseudocercospora fijiensis CIRAD86]EME89129.1 hypothetical protein MYCFIDRAFT_209994 [Pseudocercospora fijiensis CIRAD86]
MKFFAFLLTTIITARSAYAGYCNYGTAGNGGCEANGKHTYCCAEDNMYSSDFPIYRQYSVASLNPHKGTDCTSGKSQGFVACA